jgi:molybdopterin-guanine dinucleotide biosynthesis protein A
MNIYILIGGRSERMGRSKVELFLPRLAAVTREGGNAVYAVQRFGGEGTELVETIFEPPHDRQVPAFGVLRALEHARGRCIVLAVDYPTLTSAVLRILMARTAASPAALVIPRWQGCLQPLCAGYDAPRVAPRLAERIADGKLDLHGLADDVETEVLDERELPPLPNINTPEDLQEVALHMKSGAQDVEEG